MRNALKRCSPISYVFVLSLGCFAQVPHIDSITPGEGPIAGGTAVVVRGSGLLGARFSIDNQNVTATVTSEEIRFTTPRHDNGYAILRATTGAGTATARFLYIPPALKDLPPGYITTIAGVGTYYGDFGPAREAALGGPWEIGYGPDDSLYVMETHHNRVIRVRPDGVLEPFAGDGSFPNPSNPNTGPALDAWFGYPRSLLVENNGDVIIADDDTNRIYRVDAVTGMIRPIAGTGAAGFSGDGGPATLAQLHSPTFLAGDKAGTIWFIDFDNFRIRQITPDGKITTICGVGSPGFSGDGGPAIEAQFDIGGSNGYDAGGLAYDPAGLLYISEAPNRRIRRINLRTGVIETFAGPERNFGARLDRVRALMVGPEGDLYFGAAGIVRVTREGQLVERFGSSSSDLTFDGTPLSSVHMSTPLGLALDRDGNIVYTDEETRRVMRLNRRTGMLETVAGIGPNALGENGPALAASPVEATNAKPDLVVLPSGEVVFSSGPRIRKIGLDGRLSVVAFRGTPATFGEDIPAPEASFAALGIDLDANGNLFVATGDHVVYIDAQGFVRRFAGLLTPLRCDYTGDGGPARNGRLCQPGDVALDREGNAYIADTNNNRVRRVDAKTGVITTVAGSGPVNGWEGYHLKGSYCGDGGPATSACLDTPQYVAVNSQGELYIGESGRTRKVDRNGVISTVTDRGAGFMVLDAMDNVLAGGLGCGVRRLTPSGLIIPIAGNGVCAFSGDGGPAINATATSAGVGFDAEGNLYFVDPYNHRIRAVRFGAVIAPRNARAEIRGGTPQSAPLATRFADPLSVLVLDETGQAAGNARVDFTAPASGASCLTPAASVRTDRNGRAEFVCIANTVPGEFKVTASPLGSNLTLTFSLTNTAPRLASNSAVNGASFLSGAIAPGEIVTIFGAGLGPNQLVQASPGAGDAYGTELAGVRVRINGILAPLLHVRFDQVGLVVPFAIGATNSATVEVEFAGVKSNPITVALTPASPAIFTAGSTGRGQAAALNPDGTFNSPANPADRDSIIVLYATGAGITDPPSADGQPAKPPYPKARLPVTVTVGRAAAEVLYAGAAPGLVAGVLQVNVRIPASVAPGDSVPVVLTLGETASPDVTVAIRP